MSADYLASLNTAGIFSRAELYDEIEESRGDLSEANFKKILQKLLTSGELLRVGRNAYSVAAGRKNYVYEYSSVSRKVAEYMEQNNPYLDFVIMELVQLNEFVNHQIAHNMYFLYVEGDYGEYIFDSLKSMFPGKVLLYPDEQTFHRYWCEDVIVIERLVSQAPKDRRMKWHTRVEKLMVDMLADPLLKSTVSESEYPSIYEGIFDKYAVDESSLLRYAGRRGVKAGLLDFIASQTDVNLRTVGVHAQQG